MTFFIWTVIALMFGAAAVCFWTANTVGYALGTVYALAGLSMVYDLVRRP